LSVTEARRYKDFKKALEEYSLAIADARTKGVQTEADRSSLIFLHEKRSIIYTRLGLYEQAVEDYRQTQVIGTSTDSPSAVTTLRV